MSTRNTFQSQIQAGIPTTLPAPKPIDPAVSHAPRRVIEGVLSEPEKVLAIRNALRYFPTEWHETLAAEFADELRRYGRIYMYRFRPDYPMHARPIAEYPARCKQAAAIMLMIQNNLDPKVAKHPHELITYGGNGAVFQNWAQYLLTMRYLSEMTEDQTLVLYSGHPLGLFPSHPEAPRVVVTNGMMIPNYSKKEDWNRFNALGVTQYGQMTAGSFMYIGPQGIVHGTTITLLGAGRKMGLGKNDLRGHVYVTSGLGGMSGAQAGAAVITGCVGVIAEVDGDAVKQRVTDGYIQQENVFTDLGALIERMEACRRNKEAVALIYHGNIVDLWERFVADGIRVELGSDQTSCHNIHDMGYCPVGYTFAEAKQLLISDKPKFMEAVAESLRRHARAINAMADRGMYFWDYGNAFLKEAGDVGAEVFNPTPIPSHATGVGGDRGGVAVGASPYRYASYVEDIMGPLCFDYGFGPFRWVCCSGNPADLKKTDAIAARVLEEMLAKAPDDIKGQINDNLLWIKTAEHNLPVVGSYSRILYADAEGRMRISKAFNDAIASGELTGPVVLGRDHHDVSGTDSPFRETANIYDGSRYTADMAVHNVIGDSFRGATWVSLHNGGGVGWGEVINGGFGMVLDGSAEADRRLHAMLFWDVNNGIARRAWARNPHALATIQRTMDAYPGLQVTLPNLAEEDLVRKALEKSK
ncbi:MAG: urocanate hydratase [Lewinellaceae bacterium]|nr:urocanate hydratase [Lewinellaceae bacterium]